MTTQLAPRGTDDADLIARVLAGSRDDFETIVRRHTQRLFRAARAVLRSAREGGLAQLPQGNREVMVLRDVLELDTAETAACRGLTEEAVRVRLHRARAAVAAALTELTLDHVYEFDGARCDRVTCAVMAALPA